MKEYREKYAEALARKRITDKLTPQERITRLDTMLGVGQGAKRERAKLAAKLSVAPKVKARKTA